MSVSSSVVSAGKAFVELGVDDTALQKGLNKAAAKLRAFGKVLSSIGKAFMGAGAAVAAPLAIMGRQFANTGADLLDMSKRTGMSVEALSALQYAAAQTGSSLEDVETATKHMQKTLVEAASGSEGAMTALAALHLQIKDFKGLNPDQQFQKLTSALAALPDPTMRAGLAMQLFGRSGTSILPMIEEMDSLQARFKKLGFGETTDQAKQAKELKSAFTDVSFAARYIAVSVGSALAPTLKHLAEVVAGAGKAIHKFAAEHGDAIKQVFKFALATTAAGAALYAFGKAFSVVAYGINFSTAIMGIATRGFAMLAGTIGFIVSPVGLATAAIVGLGAVILDSTGLGRAGLGYLSRAFGQLASDAQTAWGAIGHALANADIGAAAKVLWATVKMEFDRGVESLDNVWGYLKFGAVATFEAIWGSLQAGWEAAFHGLKVAIIEVTTFLKSTLVKAAAALGKVWENLTATLATPIVKHDLAKDMANPNTLAAYRHAYTEQKQQDADAAEAERMGMTYQEFHAKGLKGAPVTPVTDDEIRQKELAARMGYKDQSHQKELSDIGAEEKAQLDAIENERQARRTAETQRHTTVMGHIIDAGMAAVAGAVDGNADASKADKERVAAAQAEWQKAMRAANGTDAGGILKAGLAGLTGGVNPAGLLAQAKSAAKQTSQVVNATESKGTFNAMMAQALKSGNGSDRLSQAAERAAAAAENIDANLKNGVSISGGALTYQ